MQCPVCDARMVTSDRHGVEVDHCPRCRGVWLDRGELDKLIERAGSDRYRRDHDDDDDEGFLVGGLGRRRGDGAKRRRRGFLDDLFDFD
jgi:Zn-finger nucleic acid-binding protein